jgi:hypothetical protein
MLLKTDWFAIAIATFAVIFLVFYVWSSRKLYSEIKSYPALRKLVGALIGLLTILWVLIALLLLGDVNA